MSTQSSLGIMPEQGGFSFPQSLAIKYQPSTVSRFAGLEKPKRLLDALVRSPRPCSLIFCGPPGTGKTSMGLALAQELNAGLIHIASAELTVDRVQETWERVQYYPESGGFWVVLCDEADRMSRQAQIALLSKLDGASALKPTFGGGMVRGTQIPVIWIFTCNGTGKTGTTVPESFEPRFQSRCMFMPFNKLAATDLADYLRAIWDNETDVEPIPDFAAIARQSEGLVRDALQKLDMELLMRLAN